MLLKPTGRRLRPPWLLLVVACLAPPAAGRCNREWCRRGGWQTCKGGNTAPAPPPLSASRTASLLPQPSMQVALCLPMLLTVCSYRTRRTAGWRPSPSGGAPRAAGGVRGLCRRHVAPHAVPDSSGRARLARAWRPPRPARPSHLPPAGIRRRRAETLQAPPGVSSVGRRGAVHRARGRSSRLQRHRDACSGARLLCHKRVGGHGPRV